MTAPVVQETREELQAKIIDVQERKAQVLEARIAELKEQRDEAMALAKEFGGRLDSIGPRRMKRQRCPVPWIRFMWGQRSDGLRLYGVIFRWRVMLAVGLRDSESSE